MELTKKQKLETCIYCSKKFKCYKASNKKYCNNKCYWLDKKGKSFTNSGQFKKGSIPWAKGRRWKSVEHSKLKKEMYKNKENHPHYGKFKKHSSQNYSNIHKWMSKYFGKANKCENLKCKNISKTFVWANISGEYRRDKSDFMMLCQSCHIKADKNGGIEKSNVIYRISE